MSLSVFLAVLFAAALHAGWNALIKTGVSKLASMLILTLVQGGIGAAIAAARPLPGGEVWPWLAASGLLHAAYKLFLSFAYEHGDLSRVYPIARGSAPLLVLAASPIVLADRLAPMEIGGIIALGAGILMMSRGVFRFGESARLIPFALASAAATAGYSLVDGMGARVAGDAVTFVAWLFVLDAALFTPAALAFRGTAILRAGLRDWGLGALAALASYGAYAIAVWAMTRAPVALVAGLRETSILFAVLIGWLAFSDRMDRGKAAAVALIVGGVVLTRL